MVTDPGIVMMMCVWIVSCVIIVAGFVVKDILDKEEE